jgi:hypothetical protein
MEVSWGGVGAHHGERWHFTLVEPPLQFAPGLHQHLAVARKIHSELVELRGRK